MTVNQFLHISVPSRTIKQAATFTIEGTACQSEDVAGSSGKWVHSVNQWQDGKLSPCSPNLDVAQSYLGTVVVPTFLEAVSMVL